MKFLKHTVVLPLLAATASGQALQSPSPMHISRAGGQVQLTWQGENLRPYQIEAGSDLLTWAEIGPMFVGAGNPLGYTHTNTAPRQFYRLREGAMRPGFDEVEFERNDDLTYPFSSNGYPPPELVAIGFSVLLFGNTYTHCFVNNNGNITFDKFLYDYTPFDLGSLERVMFAPFWADVDTRHEQSGIARFSGSPGIANGRPAFGVTWRSVGYYDKRINKTNSFQLILSDRSDVAAGDFDIEFNYDQIEWETGEASSSGGVDGLGGNTARVGWANGARRFMEYKGSGQTLAFLDKKPGENTPNFADGLKYQMWNSTVPGRIIIPVRGGIPTSEPGYEFHVNAGADQSLAQGAGRGATLTGTLTPANVSGVTYQWTQVNPPEPQAEISDPDSLVTSVVIPLPGEYEFQLVASKQGTFISSSSDRSKLVHPDEFDVYAGGIYYFDASTQNTFQLDWVSAEYNGNSISDVEWVQIAGDPCSISDSHAIIPVITFPSPGWYAFTLTGRSGGLANWEQSSTANVLISEPITEP